MGIWIIGVPAFDARERQGAAARGRRRVRLDTRCSVSNPMFTALLRETHMITQSCRPALGVLMLVMGLTSTAFGSQVTTGVAVKPEPARGVVGDLRLVPFTSRTFGNTRMLRVLLPERYDAPENRTRRYPVLYLNDGQNLFDSSTAVLNRMEWRVDETVQALVAAGHLPPIIVVGMDNAGRRDRFKEYFPWIDEFLQPPEPNPQGKHYPSFLIDEVIPFIDARFRTMRDPAGRVVGGSSAGGLAALYAVVKRPGVFGGVLIESPSLYLDNFHVIREAATVRLWPRRIYLGAGTNESGGSCDSAAVTQPELVRHVRQFADTLLHRGVEPSRIRVLVTPCGRHNEAAWGARLPTALRFLFGRDN